MIDGGPSNNTWTYKVGLSWEPVADLKLRGNYASAVRAPNIYELFSPLNRGPDQPRRSIPARARHRPPTPTCARSALRRAHQPARSVRSPTRLRLRPTPRSGGNINLLPEKATTWTVGAVFQPSFAAGLLAVGRLLQHQGDRRDRRRRPRATHRSLLWRSLCCKRRQPGLHDDPAQSGHRRARRRSGNHAGSASAAQQRRAS